jgi:hypothetical protein
MPDRALSGLNDYFWPHTQGGGKLVELACLALGFHILAFQAASWFAASVG